MISMTSHCQSSIHSRRKALFCGHYWKFRHCRMHLLSLSLESSTCIIFLLDDFLEDTSHWEPHSEIGIRYLREPIPVFNFRLSHSQFANTPSDQISPLSEQNLQLRGWRCVRRSPRHPTLGCEHARSQAALAVSKWRGLCQIREVFDKKARSTCGVVISIVTYRDTWCRKYARKKEQHQI